MDEHLRIVFKGHYGKPTSPPASFNYLAQAAWDKSASPTGYRSNVRLYGGGNATNEAAAAAQPVSIGLTYTTFYDPLQNVTSAWTGAVLGNSLWFETLSKPFRNGCSAVHYLYAGGSGARFVSQFNIAKNRAWCVRSYLFKPTETDLHHIVAWHWDGWRLEAFDGKFYIARLRPAWTQGNQSTLDTARAAARPDATAQASIDAQIKTLYYEGLTPLDLGVDADSLYNRPFEIVIICEPRGRLHVEITGAGSATVDNPDILATKKAGTMWGAGPLTFSVNRGRCFWQFGQLYFARIGQIVLPQIRWLYATSLKTYGLIHNGQYDASSGGTSITFDVDDSPNPVFPRVFADLAGDGNNTPWLYSFASFKQQGERDGNDTAFLDTENFLDSEGAAPITRFIPSCEGEKCSMKLCITLDNPANALGLPMGGRDLNRRMCDVYLDGVKWLGAMQVRNVSISPVHTAHADVLNGDYSPILSATQGVSAIDLDLVDLRAKADKDRMKDDPVLDGMVLSEAIRIVLQGSGATAAELAGIGATPGVVIETAGLGESPCCRPSRDMMRGDFLDFIMQNWGTPYGYELTVVAGVWTLAPISTSTYIIDTNLVEELELTDDDEDVDNIFPYEGADELVQTWTVMESILDPTWRGYQGEYRYHETTRDDGKRTAGAVLLAARGVANQQGKPGRLASFKYPFKRELLPTTYFELSGVRYQIERIEPDDQSKIEMERITGREVIKVS